MTVAPFLKRELIVSVRRGGAFSDRRVSALLPAVVIVGSFVVWDWLEWNPSAIESASWFALSTFGCVIASLTFLAIGLVPSLVAPAIASERDRKSLDSLLATRLSASEIVLGVTASGLLRYGNSLAAALPLVLLLVFVGGVNPWLVVLAVAGLASTAIALAALSVAVSATARTASRAMTWSVGLAMVWMCLPQLIVMLLPRFWPTAVPWLAPVALLALESSPAGVGLSLAGVVGRGPLGTVVARMIALQLLASVGLVLWAIIRLRPASRTAHDVGARLASIRFLRARWRPRPPCGDDPVLWHEMHSGRCVSSAALWVGRLLLATWIGALAYGISWFALPAIAELIQDGYGPDGRTPSVPEVNPIARVLVGKLMGLSAGPAAGDARQEFHYVLRIVTGLLDALYVLMIAGAAAETIASERERGTWLGLIATPLTGREILHAKVLGTIWKTRGIAILIVGLWVIGLAAGAVHPIGFLTALIGLGVSAWFLAVIGVVGSLYSRDRAQATSRTLAPMMLLLALGGLPFFAPGVASVLLAGFTMPFQAWASLLSYDDVHAATDSGVIPSFFSIGIRDADGLFVVLATWLISLMAQGAAAIYLLRDSIRGFDATVGRPFRARGDCRRS